MENFLSSCSMVFASPINRGRAVFKRKNLDPRPGLCGLCFKAGDAVGFFHGQADIVQTFEQAVLFEAVDFKGEHLAV